MPSLPRVPEPPVLAHKGSHILPAGGASHAVGAVSGLMTALRRASLSLVHRLRPPAVLPATGRRAPLLLLLHGIGSNELAMAGLAPAFDPRLIVVSVRAPLASGPYAFEWFPMTFGPTGPIVDPAETATAWRRMADFVDEVVAAYDADPDRVFVGGFSQGGMVALATLLTSPGRVRGALCLSGHLVPDVIRSAAPPDSLAGKPVLVTHGRFDRTLDVELGRRAAAELRQLALDVTYREFDLDHTTNEASIAWVGSWLSARITD